MNDPAYIIKSWHFHWRFWHPKRCTCGKVYFGWWALCVGRVFHHETTQTADQVKIKRLMGLIK